MERPIEPRGDGSNEGLSRRDLLKRFGIAGAALAAGGPKFNIVYKDHKSGDPQAAQTAITELGSQGVPAKFASYADGLFAMLAGTKQYKIFTFDGGGGTSIPAQGMPFFWGTRAIT